jgi:hypothetical protein
MNHELICSWLQLPPAQWPPHHYALLGLSPGEPDVARIEQRVHECLTRLRHYQLNHPEETTEAMNRLAQAFTCLTDPAAKKAYDATLLPPAANGPPPAPVPAPESAPADPLAWLAEWSRSATPAEPPAAPAQQQADWRTEPPPQQVPVAVPPPAEAPVADGLPPPAEEDADGPAPPAEPPEPVDPVVEAAQRSLEARRGLGTKRALYYRIARTRQLLWAWEQAGKYLSKPTKRLTKLAEATELTRQLTAIRQLLRRFPPLLGEAGQPGYLVVTLARQEMIVPTFRGLLPSQRETLARDWRTGRDLLRSHRQFLRREVRALRTRSRLGRLVRAVRTGVYEHPEVLLLLMALVAVLVVIGWPFLR